MGENQGSWSLELKSGSGFPEGFCVDEERRRGSMEQRKGIGITKGRIKGRRNLSKNSVKKRIAYPVIVTWRFA